MKTEEIMEGDGLILNENKINENQKKKINILKNIIFISSLFLSFIIIILMIIFIIFYSYFINLDYKTRAQNLGKNFFLKKNKKKVLKNFHTIILGIKNF
jgi:ATP-dependent Zn protease